MGFVMALFMNAMDHSHMDTGRINVGTSTRLALKVNIYSRKI